MACGEAGARAAAVELKDTLDGTAPGVVVDVMLAAGTLSATAAGGTLDGVVAGGVVVNKEFVGTLDGTVVCGVVVDTEAAVAVDAAVGTEAVGALLLSGRYWSTTISCSDTTTDCSGAC